MDRRNPTPDPNPPLSGFPCPLCASVKVRLATVADLFFYLRCHGCGYLWSHPERRQMLDRRRVALRAFNDRAS